jgi:hypothetical protein
MIIESGVIVFIGLLLLFLKLPRRTALRLLGRPLALDFVVSAFTLLIHWGTFSGVMTATVAGLMTSAFSTIARRLVGWIDGKGRFHAGLIAIQP